MKEETDEYTPLVPDHQNSPTVRAVIKHRRKLAYVNGFWFGYSLALSAKENEK